MPSGVVGVVVLVGVNVVVCGGVRDMIRDLKGTFTSLLVYIVSVSGPLRLLGILPSLSW